MVTDGRPSCAESVPSTGCERVQPGATGCNFMQEKPAVTRRLQRLVTGGWRLRVEGIGHGSAGLGPRLARAVSSDALNACAIFCWKSCLIW